MLQLLLLFLAFCFDKSSGPPDTQAEVGASWAEVGEGGERRSGQSRGRSGYFTPFSLFLQFMVYLFICNLKATLYSKLMVRRSHLKEQNRTVISPNDEALSMIWAIQKYELLTGPETCQSQPVHHSSPSKKTSCPWSFKNWRALALSMKNWKPVSTFDPPKLP